MDRPPLYSPLSTSSNTSVQPSIETQRARRCEADPLWLPCQKGIYSYILNHHANMAFLILFTIVALLLVTISLARRRAYAYSVAMTAGLAFETLGYAARVWSFNNQLQTEPFYMQIVCLTVGPAFMAAAIYFCMRRMVVCFGPEYSPISPDKYTRIFIPCDIVSLVLQATGGALAAKAHKAHDQSALNRGTDIMIAGLAFQVTTMFVFGVLGLVYVWRVAADYQVRVRDHLVVNANVVALRSSVLLKAFIWSIVSSTLLIFARCCYRVAELSGGWSGVLMKNQSLFIVCEGVFILIASLLLTIAHPAITATVVLEAGGQLGTVRNSLSKVCCFVNGERSADEESGPEPAPREKDNKDSTDPVVVPPAPQPQSDPVGPLPDLSTQVLSRRGSHPMRSSDQRI